MIKSIKSNPLYANSLIFLSASLIGSIVNYVFHFLMVRMLTPSGYGELQSLIALLTILGIPLATLTTVVTKYTAVFKAQNFLNKTYLLLKKLSKNLFFLSLIFLVIFLVLIKPIANFLQIDNITPLIILAIGMVITFFASLNNGLLQGLQKFKDLSLISVISVFCKLLLAYIFIRLSLAVSGAVAAIVASGIIGYILTFLPLRFLFKFKNNKNIKLPKKEMLNYSSPVFLTLLFTTLLYNLDIILVKHFFNPELAGTYAALILLGHIVFFAVGPLIGVMFPMTVEAHTLSKNHVIILKKSLKLAILIGVGLTLFYFLIPDIIIKNIVSSKFLSLAPYLGWFSLAMFFYSLIFLFAQYLLSIHKTKFVWLLAACVLCQTIFISIWHQNLWQIVWIMNSVMSLGLILLIIYYLKTNRLQITRNL